MDIIETVKKIKALDNEIKIDILSYLVNNGAKSITDISKELKLNFSTTHKYLEQFEKAKLVKSKQEVKGRLKRMFYINDFEIRISPQVLSRYPQTTQIKKSEHKFNVVTLTGKVEQFDRTRFIKQFLELGLPQNIIDLILDSTLPNAYNNITTLELRKRFIQELKSRASTLTDVISGIKEIRQEQRNYLNFISSIHPEAIESHIEGEIFIENLGKPKLLNFVHDLRGISVHGVTGKEPKNLSEFLNQILKATSVVLNFSNPTHCFESLNYFLSPYTEKLQDFEIERKLNSFLKKLSEMKLKSFISLDIGEPEFTRDLSIKYFIKYKNDVYSKYTKEAERIAKIIARAVKPHKNVSITFKVWEHKKYLDKLIRPNIFLANMTPDWQKEGASYIYESRFDSTWKSWFRTVRVGIVQNIAINLPLLAKRAKYEKEFLSKLKDTIKRAIDYQLDMSNLFLTGIRNISTMLYSTQRKRWTYVQFNDSPYAISLANINESANILGKRMPIFRKRVLSLANKIMKDAMDNCTIRLILKEVHNPVVINRFREINKINGILYPAESRYTIKELIDSANHDKLNGGHVITIKANELNLDEILSKDVGLIKIIN